MYTYGQRRFGSIYSILSTTLLCASFAALNTSAFAQLNNGSPSKVAVPMTAAINVNLLQTESQELITQAQQTPATELLFEVERVSHAPETSSPDISNTQTVQTAQTEILIEVTRPVQNSPAIEPYIEIIPVTYVAAPNSNRRATPSKIAVATEIPATLPDPVIPPALTSEQESQQETFLQDQYILAEQAVSTQTALQVSSPASEFDIITTEALPARVTTSALITPALPLQQNIIRRPTPSKIAVNANITVHEPAPIIPPRDASTHFYLSAPSKTPVAALEVISTRSSQLPLQLNATSVLIIDQNSREILYSKNPLDAMPIASITKLMTAMVVLDAKQNLNQKITITSADIDTLKSTSSRLYVGAQLTRRDLLHLALMSSENRAAHALSRNYPGGKKAFIAAMNKKAHQLGMTQTFYADPTGLSNQNRSSARDLVWLVDAAYKYDLIRNLSTSNKHRVTAGQTRLNYTTSNHLVQEKIWNIGLQKTGYIREAGYCLVMQTQISGKSLIMVLLDADAKKNRTNDANNIRRWIAT